MKTKKILPIYILILLGITILYIALAVKPLGKEYQFSPVWRISVANPTITSVNTNIEKMYFRLNNSLGYFTENGDITFHKFFTNKASISDSYFATYNSDAKDTVFFNKNGIEAGHIMVSGFPFFKDDLVFVFLPGGASFAKCDNKGNILWAYEGTLPITAFAAKENYTAVGFANGYIKVFDTNTGSLQISYAPGGSDSPVILGLDISEDGQYIASVSGHNKQRFVLSKREKNQQKIIYHNFLEGDISTRTIVHFCKNNDVLYNFDGNLGLYDFNSGKNKIIPIEDRIISIEEGDDLIYLLSKNGNNYTISLLENTNSLEGSFSFKANSAFIKSSGNNIYVGKDDSISRIKVTKE